MTNETTQTRTGKQIREEIAKRNPAFSDRINYDGAGGYRGKDSTLFFSIVKGAKELVSPVFLTYHTQDDKGDHRYRAWTQVPPRFLEGRRPDWGCNEDIAIAELWSPQGIRRFLDESNERQIYPFLFSQRVPFETVRNYRDKLNEKGKSMDEYTKMSQGWEGLRTNHLYWAEDEEMAVMAVM